MTPAPVPAIAADLAGHPAYARVFQPGRLTIGFIAPPEGYPNAPWPTLETQDERVARVDAAGFAAIWLRTRTPLPVAPLPIGRVAGARGFAAGG